MPYTSSPGGLYNSGVFPNSRPQVQVAPILDALTSGATSLIHGAMVRRQAQNEMAMRAQQFGLEQSREAREAAHQSAQLDLQRRDFDLNRQDKERDFNLRDTEARRKFITEGGIPSQTSTSTEQVGQQTPIAALNPPSPITQSMTNQLPGVQTTPGAGVNAVPAAPVAPAPSVMAFHPETTTTTTPESYDPTRAIGYARTIGGIQARGDVLGKLQSEKLAAQQAGREYNGSIRVQIERENNAGKNSRAADSNAIRKSLTAKANETRLASWAAGSLEAHNGDLESTIADLTDTDDGQALMAAGMTPQHILGAFGKYNAAKRASTISLERGPAGLDPAAAADAVKKTEKAIGTGKKSKTTYTTPGLAPSTDSPFTSTPKVGAKPAPTGDVDLATSDDKSTPSGSPAAKVGAAAKSATGNIPVASTDYSDDEIRAAARAGNKTDADIAKWIDADRAKKKVKK